MFWQVLVIYLVYLTAISIWLSRGSTDSSFAMANRELGSFSIFSSVFTIISPADMVFIAALAFFNQGDAVLFLAGYGIGFMVLGYLALNDKFNENRHYLSLPDMIYDKCGKSAGLLFNVITILAFFLMVVITVYSGSAILSAFTPLSIPVSIILIMIVVTLYLLFSGFEGVIVTDIVQLVLILIGIPLLAFSINGVDNISRIFEINFDPLLSIGVIISGILVVMGRSDVWQRVYAAKSSKATNKGLISAGLLFIVFSVLLTLIGFEAKYSGLTDNRDLAFIAVVTESSHGFFSYLILLGIFSAILSTADTVVFMISSLLANEIRRWRHGPEACVSSEVDRNHVRMIIPVISILVVIACLSSDSLLMLYEVFMILIMMISPIVLIVYYREINPRRSTIVILIGIISLFVGAAIPTNSVGFGFIVAIPGLVVGYLISKKRPKAEA